MIVNTHGFGQSGITVRAYQGETDSGISSVTDEYGLAQLSLPYGAYRFAAEKEAGGAQFWSGEADHCAVPNCIRAMIHSNPQTEVSVLDEAGSPLSGVEVAAYSDESDSGYRAVSGENGHAVFLLPEGDYRIAQHLRAVRSTPKPGRRRRARKYLGSTSMV